MIAGFCLLDKFNCLLHYKEYVLCFLIKYMNWIWMFILFVSFEISYKGIKIICLFNLLSLETNRGNIKVILLFLVIKVILLLCCE